MLRDLPLSQCLTWVVSAGALLLGALLIAGWLVEPLAYLAARLPQ